MNHILPSYREHDKREFNSTASLKLLLQYLFGTYRNEPNTTPRDLTPIRIKLALGAYMQEYIWKLLGMNSSTLRLSDCPDIEARLPIMASWSPTNTLVDSDVFTEPLKSTTKDIGGTGMYSNASDFMKLLIAILRNDGTLLSKESVAELLVPQVKNSSYIPDESNE
jgi:hypothetical protein